MGEHRFMAGFAFRAPGVPSPCHPANAAALRLCRGPVPAAAAIPSAWGCRCCPCCLCSPCYWGASAIPAAVPVPHSLRVSVLFLLPVLSLLPVPPVPTLGKLCAHNPGFPASDTAGFCLWHSQRLAVPESLPGCHSRR